MIQKVNPQTNPPTGPEVWGSWGPPSPWGRKYYSLEVVQHPLRARMCGFGDKDRRPLAPAAVAKMHVRREDHSFVDVDEVDCSFFLVTVDLWSADGSKEMNLVLHPTSSDRYVPSHASKKRRATTSSTAPPTSHQSDQSPVPPTPSSSQYPPPSSGMAPYMQPSPSGYNPQAYPFPPQPDTSNNFPPYGPGSDPSTWGYPAPNTMDRSSQQYGPHALPPMHNLARSDSQGHAGPSPEAGYDATSPTQTNDGWHVNGHPRDDADPYRTWPAEAHPYTSIENDASSTVDPTLRGAPATTPGSHNQPWPTTPMDPYSNARYSVVPVPGPVSNVQPIANGASQQPGTVENSMYASASYAQHQHQQQAQAQAQAPYAPGGGYAQESPPPSTIPPLPRHTYTRTLVGPLSANACRLLDEHRKPGIFFLFQDLSIRTEGTFRLRLRLMNVGAPPAPEPGGTRVHTDVSPVLAQTFTEPFTVFSAKRFPGVPDTTALSIALGNQGQKLPLRNRNSTKGRKRQRHGSDESGEESDDG